MADPARPPADAYSIVVPHLPPGYLTTPPPDLGMVVHVAATSDNVNTEWAMCRRDAMALMRVLLNLPGLRLSSTPYWG